MEKIMEPINDNSIEFTLNSCNIELKIKEIKPFYVCSCEPLILDLKVLNPCNTENYIEIKTYPKHGKIRKIEPSLLIYRADKKYYGMDKFQLSIKDNCGNYCVETVILYIED